MSLDKPEFTHQLYGKTTVLAHDAVKHCVENANALVVIINMRPIGYCDSCFAVALDWAESKDMVEKSYMRPQREFWVKRDSVAKSRIVELRAVTAERVTELLAGYEPSMAIVDGLPSQIINSIVAWKLNRRPINT